MLTWHVGNNWKYNIKLSELKYEEHCTELVCKERITYGIGSNYGNVKNNCHTRKKDSLMLKRHVDTTWTYHNNKCS
eukprot:16212410-Heterocapsa_arctica.AAC.1